MAQPGMTSAASVRVFAGCRERMHSPDDQAASFAIVSADVTLLRPFALDA